MFSQKMLKFYSVAAVVALCVVSTFAKESKIIPSNPCAGSCPPTWRCSPYTNDDPVYGLQDNVCVLYKTPCLLGKANCDRANLCQSSIQLVEKQDCEPYVPVTCDVQDPPVCGWFTFVLGTNNIDFYLPFNCIGEMNKFSFLSGSAYISYTEGTQCP